MEAQLLSTISQIPLCVQNATLQAIEDSHCRDFECMCEDDSLLQTLVYDLLRRCEPVDQNKGLKVAQTLCLSVIPSLNDSRGTEIVAIVAVMAAVSTVAVILRLIGRRISAARYGADDFLIIVALFLTYALNVNEIIAVHFGFGRHQLMLSLENIARFLLNDWTIQIIFASAITVTRLSLLVFYHRLFPVKRFTIVAIITGCVLIAWWISFLFAIIFSCRPVQSYWNKSIIDHCFNEHTLSWGITGSELGVNIIMVVLPIPWLWDLRLPWSKRFALIGIFMLGCFVCVSCIVRFPLLAAVKQTDASWTIVPAGIWIVVECNIGIASVCLPLMRPLVGVDFSSLGNYLPFSKQKRNDSPFDDLETSGGTNSIDKRCYEKPYNGTFHPHDSQQRDYPSSKLHMHGGGFYDKPYDGTCGPLDSRQTANRSSRPSIRGGEFINEKIYSKPCQSRYSRQNSQCLPQYGDRGGQVCVLNPYVEPCHARNSRQGDLDRSSKPLIPGINKNDDRKRGVRTHRSRIESYSPDSSATLASAKEKSSTRRHTATSSTLASAQEKPSNRRHTATSNVSASSKEKPSNRRHTATSTTPAVAKIQPLHRRHAILFDTSASAPAATSRPPNHIAEAAAPAKQKPRRQTVPHSQQEEQNERYKRWYADHRPRRNTVRLSQEEMNERYKMWYQGRGSEVGRGLWSLELISPGAKKTTIRRDSEIPWEVEEDKGKEKGRQQSSIAPPKSRL